MSPEKRIKESRRTNQERREQEDQNKRILNEAKIESRER